MVTATVAAGALVAGLAGSGSLASAGTVGPAVKTLMVTTTSLPAGTAGVPYSAKLTAKGGVRPYSWSISSGALPAGLTLHSATGAISGTPRAGGTTGFTVQVTDSAAPAATATAGLSITAGVAPLVVTTINNLPTALLGVPYAVQLGADGGVRPYAWSVSGTLPAGLKIGPGGLISGTPTTTGTADFVVLVTDSESPAATTGASETLTVTTPLSVATTSLPDATVGQPYSATLAASGGVPPYIWQTGDLPPGLILDLTTGEIEGTPTTPGTYPFTALVRDQSVPEATANSDLSITVNPGS
jgi:large repetitive protein